MAAPRDRGPFRVPQPGDWVNVRPRPENMGHTFFDTWTSATVVSSEDYLFQVQMEGGERLLLQLAGEGSNWYRGPKKVS